MNELIYVCNCDHYNFYNIYIDYIYPLFPISKGSSENISVDVA